MLDSSSMGEFTTQKQSQRREKLVSRVLASVTYFENMSPIKLSAENWRERGEISKETQWKRPATIPKLNDQRKQVGKVCEKLLKKHFEAPETPAELLMMEESQGPRVARETRSSLLRRAASQREGSRRARGAKLRDESNCRPSISGERQPPVELKRGVRAEKRESGVSQLTTLTRSVANRFGKNIAAKPQARDDRREGGNERYDDETRKDGDGRDETRKDGDGYEGKEGEIGDGDVDKSKEGGGEKSEESKATRDDEKAERGGRENAQNRGDGDESKERDGEDREMQALSLTEETEAKREELQKAVAECPLLSSQSETSDLARRLGALERRVAYLERRKGGDEITSGGWLSCGRGFDVDCLKCALKTSFESELDLCASGECASGVSTKSSSPLMCQVFVPRQTKGGGSDSKARLELAEKECKINESETVCVLKKSLTGVGCVSTTPLPRFVDAPGSENAIEQAAERKDDDRGSAVSWSSHSSSAERSSVNLCSRGSRTPEQHTERLSAEIPAYIISLDPKIGDANDEQQCVVRDDGEKQKEEETKVCGPPVCGSHKPVAASVVESLLPHLNNRSGMFSTTPFSFALSDSMAFSDNGTWLGNSGSEYCKSTLQLWGTSRKKIGDKETDVHASELK